MRRTLIGLGLCLMLLEGCRHRPAVADGPRGPRASEFYPLAVGNRWQYDTRFLGERRKTVVEIVRETDGFFEDNQGGRLRVDSVGVRDDKRYLLQEPIEEGRTWTNILSERSVEHYKIVAVGERCEAPAGVYQGCVRVEARNRVDARATLVNELTFAPRVGLVRMKVVAEAGGKLVPQTELQLEAFEKGRP